MSFQEVAQLADFEDDIIATSAVDEQGDELEIAIVRRGDEIFAIYDICSHQHVNLSEGDLDDCSLECWLHGSRFNLRTGAAINLPATAPVPVYPVKIEGESIVVDIANPIQEK